MKKSLFLFSLLSACCISDLNAQWLHRKVESAGGGVATAGGAQVRYTIGQGSSIHCYIGTIPSLMVFQGFEQPDFSAVGLSDITGMPCSLNVFPNPATSLVTIESRQEEIKTLELFNLLGEKVFSKATNNGQQITISISQLSAGMYFLSIGLGQEKVVAKIQKL